LPIDQWLDKLNSIEIMDKIETVANFELAFDNIWSVNSSIIDKHINSIHSRYAKDLRTDIYKLAFRACEIFPNDL
jgi:hypothetical protein